MFLFHSTVKLARSGGLRSWNLLTSSRPRKQFASSIISRSKDGHWRLTRPAPKKQDHGPLAQAASGLPVQDHWVHRCARLIFPIQAVSSGTGLRAKTLD